MFDFSHLVFFEVLFLKAKFENPFAHLKERTTTELLNYSHYWKFT